jgi:uncharacterized protein YkwD
MRVSIWLGAIVLALAVTTGGALALGLQTDGAHAPTVARPVAASGSSSVAPLRGVSRPASVARTSRPAAPAHAPAPAHTAAPIPRPVAPSIVIGSTQQVLINKDRAGAGRRALSWSSCLYSVALSNARRMAKQGFISHTNGPNVDLGCHLGSYAGENVGYWSGGVNDAQINRMFMSSPDHRANIMGPYHYVATAWVTAPNGVAYIAVEFA